MVYKYSTEYMLSYLYNMHIFINDRNQTLLLSMSVIPLIRTGRILASIGLSDFTSPYPLHVTITCMVIFRYNEKIT